MQKKSIVLLIITIVTILGVVGLSAYAYFATTVSNSANIAANVKTIGGAYSFTVKTSGDINMNVNLNDMLESKASSTAIKNDNANVVVNLQSPSDSEVTLCEYDVVWNWGDTSAIYSTKDSGAPAKEFTVSLLKNSQTVVSEIDLTNLLRNDKKVTLYHGTSISSSLTGIEDTYKIESKIYNLSVNQPNIKGKNFTGKITVENVDCSIDSLWGRYVPVEYIESSGTQYIDTGYSPTSQKLKIDYVFSYNSIADSKALYSITSSNDSEWFVHYKSASDPIMRHYFGSSTISNIKEYSLNTKYEEIMSVNNGTYSVINNGEEKTGTYSGRVSTTGTLHVSGRKITGVQSPNAKTYSVKFWDNDVLVRDMVPVKDTKTNKYGLYDRITNLFYGNSGTGDFTGGNEIKRIEYLESNGGQYIDTGLVLSNDIDFDITYKGWMNSDTDSAEYPLFSTWVSSYNYFNCFLKSNGDNTRRVDVYTANHHIFSEQVVVNQKININLLRTGNEYSLKVDNNDYIKWTYTGPVNNTTLKIMNRGDLNKPSYYDISISNFILNQQNQLARNYIPVKMNGVGYMLDTVEWKLYANVGSGTFTLGNEF